MMLSDQPMQLRRDSMNLEEGVCVCVCVCVCCVHVCACTQLCSTLCNPMVCSLPASSVHGIFQTKLLEWAAISYPR